MDRSKENLKSRSLHLLPRRCVSISLVPSVSAISAINVLSSPSLSSRHCTCPAEKERESVSSANTTSTSSGTTECQCHQPVNVVGLFHTFIRENLSITPYTGSSGLLRKLDLLGVIYPSTLLVTGPTDAIDMLCLLWAKRLLKAPTGYNIRFIGDTCPLEVTTLPQTQFTPLAEALYKCLAELSSLQQSATFDTIVRHLQTEFPSTELPSVDILHASLNALVAEKRISFDVQTQVFSVAEQQPPPPPQQQQRQQQQRSISSWEDVESVELKNDKSASTESSSAVEDIGYDNHHNGSKAGMKSPKERTPRRAIKCASLHRHCDSSRLQPSLSSSSSSSTTTTVPSSNASTFQRSRSLRLNYKHNNTGEEDESDASNGKINKNKKCTCQHQQEIVIKRQSLLSKLLKLAPLVDKPTSRGLTAAAAGSNNFASQFPEDGVIDVVEERTKTQSTQTVKCGPEEIVNLFVRPAAANSEDSWLYRLREAQELCQCPGIMLGAPLVEGRTTKLVSKSRGTNSKRNKYRQQQQQLPTPGCAMCHSIELVGRHNQQIVRGTSNRTRRLRNSSTRAQSMGLNKLACRGNSLEIIESQTFDIDHRSMECALNNQPPQSNNVTSSQREFVLNNSLKVKIEIETSKQTPKEQSSDSIVNSLPINNDNIRRGEQFANDIYSELTFEKENYYHEKMTSTGDWFDKTGGQMMVAKASRGKTSTATTTTATSSSSTSFDPTLNYANSVTALKEQIARAKAKFFSSPLS